MRKSFVYLVLGVAVVGACVSAALLVAQRQPELAIEQILADYREEAKYGNELKIHYPLDETLFPPEIAPPTFRWKDDNGESDAWVVTIKFQDNQERMSFSCPNTTWKPSEEGWEAIKTRSTEKPATVSILGVNRAQSKILSAARITLSTSKDEVGAPLFYREVNLPFADAVKDPGSHIRWRFGPVSSRETPPIVLENVPNCANCHSFTADGSTLAMEIDSANDKGSYVVASIEEEMYLKPSMIFTWSDYRREDNEPTFGLLPQISPDGKHVVCMVKDRSVFVAKPGLEFSQLFFPIKGILVYYHREAGTFHALPGAGDKRFVHANPTWSPDGKHIVFARSRVHKMERAPDIRSASSSRLALLTQPECEKFLKEVGSFQYDLYRIPFNDGRGGEAEPVEGASHNGKSNYFAKYSPDGKWIVFCKSKNFMLLQPDSELFIIPAEGGEARKLRCNTPRMNSWHSWSPNGKWLVFSSKWNSPYTELFLTHMDEQGRSTPPVLLENFTDKNRAANIPEFVNAKPDAIKIIHSNYLDDTYYVRSGGEFRRQMDFENAIPLYRQALELNPDNVRAHVELGDTLVRLGKPDEAQPYFTQAIELEPENHKAHEGMGAVLADQGDIQGAVSCYREAVRIEPKRALARFRLGVLLMDSGELAEATTHLAEAARLDRNDPQASCFLGVALLKQGEPALAVPHFQRTLDLDPESVMALVSLASIFTGSPNRDVRAEAVQLAQRACELTGHQDPGVLVTLAQAQAEVGRFPEAASAAEQALRMAEAAGKENMAVAIQQALESYQRQEPYRPGSP